MKELKYMKYFEQFNNLDETNEGIFSGLNPIIGDIAKKLKLFFGIEDKKVAENVYNQLTDLKKQGKINSIIANGLTRDKKDTSKQNLIPLNIENTGDMGLFFNPSAKGFGMSTL